jgi:LmbE family N-acetylglucosaminyl deacetylase
MRFGKKILLLVPHPDDEVVGFAASIGQAKAEGAEVFALYLTHGCIDRETRWFWDRKRHDVHVALRRAEALVAAEFLGLAPVGWSERAARHLWRELPLVYDEVAAAVAEYGIDQIWTPAFEGGNADHDAVNAVASLFAPKVEVLEFAEYNFANSKTMAQSFPFPNGTETDLWLTEEEKAQKREALKIYASEKGNLFYVGTEKECFRPIAPYDYAKPPHAGTLWYARFQWVPFRHPRVDFTDPAEVAVAITAFLAQKRR